MAKPTTEEAIDLYRDGWALRKIAARYGCSENTVRDLLVKAGEPRRPPGGGLPPGPTRRVLSDEEVERIRAREGIVP